MPLRVDCRTNPNEKHTADVNTLVYKNGKLYSGADDGKIKLWDSNLNKIGEVEGHPTTVYCLSSNEDNLFSCSNDGFIKSWSLDDLKQKQIIHHGDTEVYRIYFADGILFSSDETGEIRLHKENEIKAQFSLLEPHREMIVHNGLLYTCRDLDLVITEFISDKNFQVKMALMGRAPMCIFDKFLCFSGRGGKDLCIHKNVDDYDPVAMVKDAHEMIIDALAGENIGGEYTLFSGGWDKVVKRWKINDSSCTLIESCDVNVVINVMVLGENGVLYAGCENGSIVKLCI